MTTLGSERLVFVISQPRAGSTLVQRILGGHPEIHTGSEPWLMLHPAYALKDNGYRAEYDAALARQAVGVFNQTLPQKEGDYVEAVRRMGSYLYGRALEETGKRFFLDKTPRYYFIIPELHKVFPDAHFIILLRNPLAVLASILKSWVREKWFLLYEYQADLVRAPQLLMEGKELLGKKAVVVRYEDLTNNPEGVIRPVFDEIGLEFNPQIIEYGRQDLGRWDFGDQGNIYDHTGPVAEFRDAWMSGLDDPQFWRLAHDYLQMLGGDTLRALGYSGEDLERLLNAKKPTRGTLAATVSFAWLLKKPMEERTLWEHNALALARALQLRDFRRVANYPFKVLGRSLGTNR